MLTNIAAMQLDDAYVEARRCGEDNDLIEANIENGSGFFVELSIDKMHDNRLQLSACFNDADDVDVQARLILRLTEDQVKQLVAALTRSSQ